MLDHVFWITLQHLVFYAVTGGGGFCLVVFSSTAKLRTVAVAGMVGGTLLLCMAFALFVSDMWRYT